MKRILGLDLGVSSIGWALIQENEEAKQILGMGCRIIPLSTDDKNEFSTGNAISKNQNRTMKRTQRKGYDRYQLRRKCLIEELKSKNMFPSLELIHVQKNQLWKLRADAVNKQLSLAEIGRILLHINQKRGYKSSRSEANLDKKDTEYVAIVKSRYEKLKESGLTIGQKFSSELSQNQFYRIKDQVFPRDAYLEEYDLIMRNQQKYYHDILTNEVISSIRDEIIYYQRKLKSQKGLVSVCEFEGFITKINGSDKEIFVGPKVAPRSSPLFQISRIWETINNITLRFKNGSDVVIPIEKKQEIFVYLDNNDKMTYAALLKILELKKDDVYGNKLLYSGIQGNKIKADILSCFDSVVGYDQLFKLNFEIITTDKEVFLLDKSSGEVINSKYQKYISAEVENQPYYKLWHTIYSISDKEECKNALINKFSLPVEIALKLTTLDFTKMGFANKSHRAIRKMLPYLMEGDQEYNARSYAGYYHTMAITKHENHQRTLLEKLKQLDKNSLRQPIVEKILNQMINVVNTLIDKYGKPDEIRIELARELKQSREERNETYKNINQRERENKEIEKRLAEYGLRATRNNIIKWRLYHEINNEDKKQNSICIYCGQPITLTSAILGEEVDVEHIIPKSKLFDDSQSNKTLAHRRCNSTKKDQTAFDFMRTKSEEEFTAFIERVNILFKNHLIGKAKRDKLLMPGEKIPKDFIERQLRESQYIARKSREILQSICYNVWATSGSITAELRHIWGWDDVLMNLQLPKYKELNQTEFVEYEKDGVKLKKEVIHGWSKRDDQRHHAIDALTIACSQQGFIQRINGLNSGKVRNDMLKCIEDAKQVFDKKKSLLENYLFAQIPFKYIQIQQEAANILISYKPGKKVATLGKRKIKQNGKKIVRQSKIIVPRGSLSEESIYGRIRTIEKEKTVKYLFENPHLILKSYIKQLVEERLSKVDGDVKLAVVSLKKEPIYLDEEKTIPLQYATCYKNEYVIKYPIDSIKSNDVSSIIDGKIRKIVADRLAKYDNKEKDAFKDLENNPVWYDEEKRIPIRTVRCLTGLLAVEPVKKDANGIDIGFVKPGNNHHLAIYLDESGKKQIHYCSFWHAVERKKYGIPVIIKDPSEVADLIIEDEDKFPDSFLEKIPDPSWNFQESFQQNEMFVLNLSREAFEEAFEEKNHFLISNYLFRLQNISTTGYKLLFRHHLATTLDNEKEMIGVASFTAFNPIKVKVNCLGEIYR